MFTAGDHVPDIPLFDVGDNVNRPPVQISGIGVKLGVVLFAFIVTVMISWAVIVQIGLEAIAVIVAIPLAIFGMNEVDKSVGLEKVPSRDVHSSVAPRPLTTALKFGTSPVQIKISAIGSIVGAGLT